MSPAKQLEVARAAASNYRTAVLALERAERERDEHAIRYYRTRSDDLWYALAAILNHAPA